jgi:myo-inositol-1(or 4)-monophosphatase
MDAYLHTYLKPWDYAAAALILQEAGGTIQQLDTQPLNLWQENNGIIATNTHLQTQIQNTLQLPNP